MSDHPSRRPLSKALRLLASGLTVLLLCIALAWAFGALWFDFPHPGFRRHAAAAFAAGALLVGVFVRPRRRAMLILTAAVVLVCVWWRTLEPRQFRDWKPEVALTSHAEVDGDRVTLHNMRNFDYRSESDFNMRHETRHLHLRNLRGVDMFINYWGSPYMAHPILSFDFGPDGRVCFSIETRQEKGEGYSAIGGLYRRFELIYVVADERDVIRLRSNHRRGEDVYLYRLNAPKARNAFMEYIHAVNALHQSPRWYHALGNNCTTAIRHQRAASARAPWDWRIIVNGFADELLYELGAINRSLPFAELKRISRINERAIAADRDADFSDRIRRGLPGMDHAE